VDIESSARKHGVSDHDMLHALRHHWQAFETDDDAVTMFMGCDEDRRGILNSEGTDETRST